MRYEAWVTTSQLTQLKTYGLTKANISPNNIRRIQPLNGRRYWFTTAAKCPELPPKRVEPPNLDYKYIKMSHTMKIPGMVTKDAGIDDIFQT